MAVTNFHNNTDGVLASRRTDIVIRGHYPSFPASSDEISTSVDRSTCAPLIRVAFDPDRTCARVCSSSSAGRSLIGPRSSHVASEHPVQAFLYSLYVLQSYCACCENVLRTKETRYNEFLLARTARGFLLHRLLAPRRRPDVR